MRGNVVLPFVGRDRELEHITSAVRHKGGGGAVVVGPAGIGKSRLLQEVARSLGPAFAPIFVTGSAGARDVPFGAFVGLLPPGAPITSPLEMLRSVRDLLAGRTGRQRPVLFADDADQLDDVSAALVQSAAISRACPFVLALESMTNAPADVVGLARRAETSRVTLTALRLEDVTEAVEQVLGGALDYRTRHALVGPAHGNPLYVSEILRSAIEGECLRETDGVWRLASPPPPPGTLVELAHRQLGELDDAARHVVELLSISAPIGLAWLEREAGARAVERLQDAGIVKVEAGRRRQLVELAHEVHRDVVRAQLPDGRGRRIRRHVAECLQRCGMRRSEDALRFALLCLDAGDVVPDEVLARGCDEAVRLGEWETVGRLAAASYDETGSIHSGVRLAESWFKRGRVDEALALFAELLPKAMSDDERVRVTGGWVYVLSTLTGRTEDAKALIDRVLPSIRDPEPRARLMQRLAVDHLFAGRTKQVRQSVETLRSLGGQGAPLPPVAAYALSNALYLEGDYEAAVEVSEAGEREHRRNRAWLTQGPYVHLVARILALTASWSLAEADALIAQFLTVEVLHEDCDVQATRALLRSVVAEAHGQLSRALCAAREAAVINRDGKDITGLGWSLGAVALAAGQMGDQSVAGAAASELADLAPHDALFFRLDLIERGLAWYDVARGDLAAARARLRDALQAAREAGIVPAQVVLAMDLARVGEAHWAAPALASIVAQVRVVPTRDNRLSAQGGRALAPDAGGLALLVSHANALAAGDPDQLLAVARAHASNGAALLAREAAAVGASRYARSGDRRAQGCAARLADSLAAVTGPACTPALSCAAARSVGLTERENEISLLAANGMSSKEIAAMLSLSTRTVDNHLHRAFSKLGINRRADLTTALREFLVSG